MQGDLISRSALIEVFENKIFNSVSMNPIIKMLDVVEIIEDQPTAYDVEKVVAELDDVLYDYCYGTDYHIAYGKMEEVVRNGGKE